jgi:hypothetical protein
MTPESFMLSKSGNIKIFKTLSWLVFSRRLWNLAPYRNWRTRTWRRVVVWKFGERFEESTVSIIRESRVITRQAWLAWLILRHWIWTGTYLPHWSWKGHVPSILKFEGVRSTLKLEGDTYLPHWSLKGYVLSTLKFEGVRTFHTEVGRGHVPSTLKLEGDTYLLHWSWEGARTFHTEVGRGTYLPYWSWKGARTFHTEVGKGHVPSILKLERGTYLRHWNCKGARTFYTEVKDVPSKLILQRVTYLWHIDKLLSDYKSSHSGVT